jgi:type II secretory ATPase GspE/PulE/Tfp pilus assembly ATPase PilB-like protein
MPSTFQEDDQIKTLEELRRKEEESLVQMLASKNNMPYVDLTGMSIDNDALILVSEEEARACEIAPFKIVGKELQIAVRSPHAQKVKDKIAELEKKEYQITTHLASWKSLEKAWSRYKDINQTTATRGGFVDISAETLEKIASQVKTNSDIKKLIDEAIETDPGHIISRVLEITLAGGIATGSSDIHLEAQEEHALIRLRQDGVLQDVAIISTEIYNKITSRLKLLSQMKLTTTAGAQDGRFTIEYQGTEIEIRNSIIPSSYGEGFVMRILDPKGLTRGFNELGIEPKLLSILDKEIRKPNGLLLTTGPTGSGKTTTLYSFLKELYSPEIKILTIEDPIEYHLPGITQTQTNHEKGYDFLAGLRAALRQDPDIVMVGEIRDAETTKIAINASLTGHFVISTLHTNNAAGAIPRLLDLGASAQVLGSALSVVMAQRLIRRVCKDCKKEGSPTPEEEMLIDNLIAGIQSKNIDMEKEYGLVYKKGETKIVRAVGCEKCNNTGYKGRVGLYEAILMDKKMEELLYVRPSEREVMKTAQSQGLFNMQEDGLLKILRGETTFEEVGSAVDMEEWFDLNQGSSPKEIPTQQPETISTPIIVEKKTEVKLSNPIGISFNPTEKPLRDQELSLLVDYLQTLERDYTQHPEESLARKIQTARNTILEIVKNRFTDNEDNNLHEQEKLKNEIHTIVEELQNLEKTSLDTGSLPTAVNQLTAIRGIVEKIRQQKTPSTQISQ